MPNTSKQWVCAHKRAYASQYEALRALIRMEKDGKARYGLDVYACQQCGCWHLGHPKPNDHDDAWT